MLKKDLNNYNSQILWVWFAAVLQFITFSVSIISSHLSCEPIGLMMILGLVLSTFTLFIIRPWQLITLMMRLYAYENHGETIFGYSKGQPLIEQEPKHEED